MDNLGEERCGLYQSQNQKYQRWKKDKNRKKKTTMIWKLQGFFVEILKQATGIKHDE